MALPVNVTIEHSPADGHCLLHSVVSSWQYQMANRPFVPITLEELKAKIFIETVNNADQYIPFYLSSDEQSIFKGLDRYLIDRHYDQSFGDLVPVIIANALNLTLHILNENDQNRTELLM